MLKIDLTGKTAVITGATGQLGRVMVRTLAGCGADIAVHYLKNKDAAERLAQEVRAAGRRCITVQADVTHPDSVKQMQNSINQELGPVHIIVNNAIIQYNCTTILNQDPGDYESQFRSCVMQNVLMAKAFVPGMIDGAWGRVIGINTECALLCPTNQSAYVSGKRGMDGVLRTLAKEVGEYGITVNQVAPGWTVSDRDRENGTESRPEYEASIPLRRRGTDQEIANVAAFLASDLASYITGAIIPVCGGHASTGI